MPVHASAAPVARQAWQSALAGARRWRLALALYVPSLVLGLLSALPVFLAADALGRLGPWAAEVATGGIVSVLLELSAQAAEGQPPPEARQALAGLGLGATLLALGVFVQGILYNVLAGGVLARLAARDGSSFWGACRRWAWPMIWFGVLALLVVALLGGAGLVIVALMPLGGSASWLARPALALAWLAILNGWLELSRADMVARGDRRALRSLGRTLVLAARPGLFLGLLGLWLLLGLIGVVYTLVGGDFVLSVPVGLPLLALAIQQLVAFGGGWLKLLHLAVALGIAQAVKQGDTA